MALVSGQHHIIYNNGVSLKRRSSYYINYAEVKKGREGEASYARVCTMSEGNGSEEREREGVIKFTTSYNYKLWSYELCWPYAKYLGRR